jgi:drug/metabolite transporter (DMT)-like permease
MERSGVTAKKRPSFRARTVLLGLIALLCWAAASVAIPLAGRDGHATLFGLPLGTALGLPIALPALVLAMFWFATRQNLEDERAREDD